MALCSLSTGIIFALRLFASFMIIEPAITKASLLAKATAFRLYRAARNFKSEDPVFQWMLTLAEDYPGDIGVLSPILLNLICLEPGQAMFLDAGELHAYLEGLGIELMANSDNVLRGGLTPKHVDVPELLRVLKFEDRDITLLKPEKSTANELVYPCPVTEFILSVITLSKGEIYQSPRNRIAAALSEDKGVAHGLEGIRSCRAEWALAEGLDRLGCLRLDPVRVP